MPASGRPPSGVPVPGGLCSPTRIVGDEPHQAVGRERNQWLNYGFGGTTG
ncbi:hypothetical protein [Stieleria mannarensis]|nr:hypothetical protein [Rhodopirellula sp. JC639]